MKQSNTGEAYGSSLFTLQGGRSRPWLETFIAGVVLGLLHPEAWHRGQVMHDLKL